MYRVQVKNTNYGNRVSLINNYEKEGYSSSEIDFLAAYDEQTSDWFLIPIQEIELKSCVYLKNFAPFKNKWELLKAPPSEWRSLFIAPHRTR